jgi:hypothetical protein
MKPKIESLEVIHRPAVEAGPIKSQHADAVTTIWRDGEVWREDRFKRVKRLVDARAIP